MKPSPARLVSLLSSPRGLAILTPTLGVLLGFVSCAVLLWILGYDALDLLGRVLDAGFFGGWYSLSDTLTVATPLILAGVGCAIAFRAGLWNVGAEGQLLMGAWGATGMASFLLPSQTPAPLAWLAILGAAFVMGALWGLVPAVLKWRFRTSEILSTLMLVYVATHFVNYFIFVRWSVGGFQMTPLLPRSFWFPRLLDLADSYPSLAGLTVHLGFLIAVAAALVGGVLVERSAWGFEIRVQGVSPRVARYAGMPEVRNLLLVMALSGGFAGLAGATEVAGVMHRFQDHLSPGYGFTAILVAWLARLHPAAVLIAGPLVAGLLVGALRVQPSGVALLIQGTLLLSVVAVSWSVQKWTAIRPVRRDENPPEVEK